MNAGLKVLEGRTPTLWGPCELAVISLFPVDENIKIFFIKLLRAILLGDA